MARAFQNRKRDSALSSKMIGLVAESGLISLVIGCLGSIVNLIQLSILVESIGNVGPDLFSQGLKGSLFTIAYGLSSFLIARIGILVYKWIKENDQLNSQEDDK